MYESKVEIRMGIIGMLMKSNVRTAKETVAYAKQLEAFVVGDADIPDKTKDMYSAMTEMLASMPKYEPVSLDKERQIPVAEETKEVGKEE